MLAIVLPTFLMTSCGDDDEACDRGDYTGTYVGSKEGLLCQNESNFTFVVQDGPLSDEIIVDGNIMNFIGCVITSPSTTLGLGEEYEGSLIGDEIMVVQTAAAGLGSCTWRGTKQ